MSIIRCASLSKSASEPSAMVTQFFREQGVIALIQILPQAVIDRVRIFLRSAINDMSNIFSSYGIDITMPSAGRQVQELIDRDRDKIPPEHRHIFLGHFPLSVRLDKVIWEIPLLLAQEPFLYDFLQTHKLFVHMPPTARFVLPGNVEAAVPAHQDVSYNKHLSAFCIVWVPLVDIDTRCGGMAVFPGTQQLGELYKGAPVAAADGWIPKIDTSTFKRVEMHPLSAGDIVVMADKTVHESMSNTSDGIRISIDFRFFGENSGSTKHYLDLQEGRLIDPVA